MQRIWGLFKKELRAYFNSPIAYIVITVLLISIGYFFFQTFFLASQATLRSFFSFAAWSFLLFGPAITMKLFAEEKKSGTIESLLTLPVREWEVVTGKFLAAWTLLAIYLVISFAYPISIAFIGNLDGGPVIGGYIGLFFLGGTFIAIGIFASTITRNQVVSLIVAFVIGLVLFILDMLLPFVPVKLQSLVEFIGVDSHFKNVARGLIDTRDIVYSASLMAFLLFAGVQVLQARLTDRSKSRRINKFLYIGAALGCLVAINIFSYSAYGRVDLTEDKMYTLSDASRTMLEDLDDQVTIKAFFSSNLPAPFNNHARFLQDELQEYRNYSNGQLTFEFIDPGEAGADGNPRPELVAQVNEAQIPKVEVRKLEKDQVQMVKVYMGLAIYYHDQTETLPVLQNIDNLEYEISSRIAKLTRTKTPVVGFLTGHGELSSREGLTSVSTLLAEKFKVTDVNLESGQRMLSGLDVLVIAGPREEIPDYQLFYIDQYIMGGGKVAFLVDRNVIDMGSFIGRPISTGLQKLLTGYGIIVEQGLVLDAVNQQVRMVRVIGNQKVMSSAAFPPFVRVQDLNQETTLTKNMRDLTLPFVTPIKYTELPGAKVEVIAKSSKTTWLFENDDSFLVEPDLLPTPTNFDLVGPQNLVVTLEGTFESAFGSKKIPSKPGEDEPVASVAETHSPDTQMVVVGSSVWVSDDLRNSLGYLFFANLMDWMAQDDRLTDIRSRNVINRPLDQISETKKQLIKFGNMFLLPLLFISLGVVRWRLRLRRKRKGAAENQTPDNSSSMH